MSDWIGWIVFPAMVIGIAWAPVACTMNNNEKIQSAIERGINPIAASCAYSLSADRIVCALATRREQDSEEPSHDR